MGTFRHRILEQRRSTFKLRFHNEDVWERGYLLCHRILVAFVCFIYFRTYVYEMPRVALVMFLQFRAVTILCRASPVVGLNEHQKVGLALTVLAYGICKELLMELSKL